MSTGPSQDVYEALKKLDFIAVADMFMVPTAVLADIVLPVCSYLEYDAVAGFPPLPVAQVQRKVAQIGESWSDLKITSELAKKLGLGKHFWDTEEQGWDELLKPLGITFNELKKVGTFSHSPCYRNYRFGTPSGKVELYSSKLAEWGFDALPVYHELPETQYSDPELAKEYPLVLSSGKSVEYVFTTNRQIHSLRGNHPDPIITLHPETANELGIKEGDWVFVENKRGRITQKCRLSKEIDPRVVYIEPHWWFPEKGPAESYGWAESNVNVLTDNKTFLNREWGTPNLRGILCKVYKK
jgi:anaerobic selenocysteine-containing dehydrogenase